MSVPRLAREFGVSRSPISAALDLLVGKGILEPMPTRGLCVARDISDLDLSGVLPKSPLEELHRRVMRDRAMGRLAHEVSEAELIPRYEVPRGVIRKLLMRLAAEGLVQRLPGHGWRFIDTLLDDDAYVESYEFRIAVECAALNSPGFAVQPELAQAIRRAHERIISLSAGDLDGDEWFRVNAAFHERLAGFSGNRFFTESVRQQNNLRRLRESTGYFDLSADRVAQSCREHLAILDAAQQGEIDWAVALLRRHLREASELVNTDEEPKR